MKTSIRKTEDYSRGPAEVVVELTADRATDGAPSDEPLSGRQLLTMLEEIAGFGTDAHVLFTGRDPFARADILSLIRTASRLGLQPTLSLPAAETVNTTNVRALKVAGLSRMALRLESCFQGEHDTVMEQPGSFQQTLRLITEANAQWTPIEIHTTITQQNVDQIDGMADFLGRLEIAEWVVHFLVPGSQDEWLECIRPAQYEIAFEQIWRNAIYQQYAVSVGEAPHYRRYVLDREGNPPIPAKNPSFKHFREVHKTMNDGKGTMFVSGAGYVYPSEYLPLLCGVYPKDSLLSIYRDSDVFKSLRNRAMLQGRCGTCDYSATCGGCRARAFAATGDALAADSSCFNVAYGRESKRPFHIVGN